MKLVIFGLAVSSSWGNGHATIWRGLCTALAEQGHAVRFFERDVPYYAAHRDLAKPEGYELTLYSDWYQVQELAREAVRDADSAIVTSYCPDADPASDLIFDSYVPVKVFYDLDSPVTLEQLRQGKKVDYIPRSGLGAFDLVLSYAGGRALKELQTLLGARRVAPLYGSADPKIHKPAFPTAQYEADMSYLGTYSPDRQARLEALFLEPARRAPEKRFVVGGSMYPDDFPWSENIWFVWHVPPSQHAAFYCSSALTLSVTRGPMADVGYCPSGRLFEAAACAIPVMSDEWDGLDKFFEPGREILAASDASEVVEALSLDKDELRKIGTAARQRVLSEHTAAHRSRELIRLLEESA